MTTLPSISNQTHNMDIMRQLMTLSMGDPGRAAKQMADLVAAHTASVRVVKTLPNGIQRCEALDKDGLIVNEFYR